MSFNEDTQAALKEMEQELGERYSNLPAALYRFTIDEASEVSDNQGFPTLRLAFTVAKGEEQEGRQHSEFVRWYAGGDDKGWEERTATTRKFAGFFIQDLAKALDGESDKADEIVQTIIAAYRNLGDDPDQTREMMQTIVDVTVGHEIIGKVTHNTGKDGKEYAHLNPKVYTPAQDLSQL